MMNKVIVVHTGGTIAMATDEVNGTVHLQNSTTIVEKDHLEHFADVETINFMNIPSPHMTPEKMLSLAQRLQQELNREDVFGVVITHGTDTLEETAYLLDLVIAAEKPITITGSIRSNNEPGADGPRNLIHAVQVAADPQSRKRGVLVVMNDEIHAARDVRKTHTQSVNTFQSEYGPIGAIATDVRYFQPPAWHRTFPIDHIQANVPLIRAVAGMESRWLSYLLEDSVQGVVIEALGQGNVPPAIIPLLKNVLFQGKPVVLVSRCEHGFAQATYNYDGGGYQLQEMGVIFADEASGPKARIKLMVLLVSGLSDAHLAEQFK